MSRDDPSAFPCLTVPGLCGSGPDHWQSHWERGGAIRVEMDDWDAPDRARWIAAIDRAVRAAAGPVLLAGHSLGCHAIALWASAHGDAGRLAAGALLVAPPDIAQQDADLRLVRFGTAPGPLPFPAILVASSTDRYASAARSRAMAASWAARLVEIGDRGHVNAASGLGDWAEGRALLRTLANRPQYSLR